MISHPAAHAAAERIVKQVNDDPRFMWGPTTVEQFEEIITEELLKVDAQLDAAQYARFAASLAFRDVEPVSNIELIQIERED